MKQVRIAVLVALASLPILALGAGRPATPGPPNQTATPLTVVDSTGKLVGEVLKLENAGLSRAAVKYVLPSGDFVLLAATADHLTVFGQLPDTTDDPYNADAYFTTTDCSGDAYVRSGNTTQLTKRQAVVLSMPVDAGGPPTPNACGMYPSSEAEWLYVSDPLACLYPIEMVSLTFKAFYGYQNEPPYAYGCIAIPDGGFTTPLPGLYGGYRVYKKQEDLRTTFTAPFYIP